MGVDRVRLVASRAFSARFARWAIPASILLFVWAFALPWPSCEALRISAAGMVFQILGIGTVAWGIKKTRQRLGKDGIRKILRQQLKELFRESIIGSANIYEGGDAVAAVGGTVERGVVLSGSADERFQALADAIKRLSRDVSDLHTDLFKETAELRKALDAECQKLREADERVRNLLDDIETGGVEIAMAGLVWLVIGVIMTSIPGAF